MTETPTIFIRVREHLERDHQLGLVKVFTLRARNEGGEWVDQARDRDIEKIFTHIDTMKASNGPRGVVWDGRPAD